MAGLELDNVTAKDLMSKKLVTVAPDERLSDVIGKMRKHSQFELPVVLQNAMPRRAIPR